MSEETIAIRGQSAETASPSTTRIILILGILTATAPLSIDMYLPAFPTMAKELGVPLSTIQLSISAFLIGSAAGQLFYGPLSDQWGRRRPLMFGLAVFVAAAVACACVKSGSSFLAWRVVMALGGGAGMVICRAVVRDICTTAAAARMYSLLMLVMGAAPILAPSLGGQLLLISGWRGIFAFLSIFGLLCLAAVAKGLPESLPADRRVRRGVTDMAKVYGHLFRNRRYLRHVIAIGCVAGITFAYISGAPFLFMELYGISPQKFGVFFGANAFGLIGASQVNRKLLDRFTAQQILTTAFTVQTATVVVLAALASTGAPGFPCTFSLLFICLTSAGFLYPNITALAMAPFQKAAGSASAMMGTIQYIIAASAGAAVGFFHDGTAVPMTATLAVCGIVGWLVIPRHGPTDHHTVPSGQPAVLNS